jgi:hypothetical protein
MPEKSTVCEGFGERGGGVVVVATVEVARRGRRTVVSFMVEVAE